MNGPIRQSDYDEIDLKCEGRSRMWAKSRKCVDTGGRHRPLCCRSVFSANWMFWTGGTQLNATIRMDKNVALKLRGETQSSENLTRFERARILELLRGESLLRALPTKETWWHKSQIRQVWYCNPEPAKWKLQKWTSQKQIIFNSKTILHNNCTGFESQGLDITALPGGERLDRFLALSLA